jgi:hypothetical protein
MPSGWPAAPSFRRAQHRLLTLCSSAHGASAWICTEFPSASGLPRPLDLRCAAITSTQNAPPNRSRRPCLFRCSQQRYPALRRGSRPPPGVVGSTLPAVIDHSWGSGRHTRRGVGGDLMSTTRYVVFLECGERNQGPSDVDVGEAVIVGVWQPWPRLSPAPLRKTEVVPGPRTCAFKPIIHRLRLSPLV